MNLATSSFSDPKEVSIITISYNGAQTIENTIKSVLSQHYESFEYIVVDGASADGTQDIINSFGDKIDIFISEPDKGIADAFNKGVALSSGKIIGLINSDDMLLPDAIQKVYDFFAQNPDVEVLHGDILLYDDDHFVKRLKPAGQWWYPWRLVLFNHPATFVKKDVYLQHGYFNTDYYIAMDVEIFLRWMKKGVKIAYFSQPLVKMHRGGVSGRHAFLGYGEVKRALISYGFSRVLTNIQYFARYGVHLILRMQEKLSSIRL